MEDSRISKTECKKFPLQLLVDSAKWDKPAAPKPKTPKAKEGGAE